ncbi:MAG: FecR domain-containing protein, partial [Bdellovibrionales bacterium]|nr:FecR domain-containing protein [Bdellovibrionales bacterium]
SCDCPKLECEPCFEEQGVTFYSEKCGPNQSRVKSCARPTCVPLDPKPPQCKSAQNQVQQRKIASTVDKGPLPASKQMMDRRLAEFKNELRGKDVGTVQTVMGKAYLKLPSGEEMKIVQGTRVHEKDGIHTTLRGHVKIVFDDGNIANIKPNSEIIVQEYKMGEGKRAILNLIKGKVRSKVKEKYNGDTTFYRVKTKSAVAGVRGTDFVVEYNSTDRIITQVTTFEGTVAFGGNESDEQVDIHPGQQASFIVASNDSEVFSKDEVNEFVAKGYMTPVYSLSQSELDELVNVTEIGDGTERKIASTKNEAICSSPKAQLNQCAWVCKNNPKGEKRCRTDLPQVNCVRTKCDANGNWADESRLPASFYDSCQPQGFKVGPCDY